jgi:hypothetical protein
MSPQSHQAPGEPSVSGPIGGHGVPIHRISSAQGNGSYPSGRSWHHRGGVRTLLTPRRRAPRASEPGSASEPAPVLASCCQPRLAMAVPAARERAPRPGFGLEPPPAVAAQREPAAPGSGPAPALGEPSEVPQRAVWPARAALPAHAPRAAPRVAAGFAGGAAVATDTSSSAAPRGPAPDGLRRVVRTRLRRSRCSACPRRPRAAGPTRASFVWKSWPVNRPEIHQWAKDCV